MAPTPLLDDYIFNVHTTYPHASVGRQPVKKKVLTESAKDAGKKDPDGVASPEPKDPEDVKLLRDALREAAAREAALKLALQEEKELHQCAVLLLQEPPEPPEAETEAALDRQNELEFLSSELEERETDLLNFQFDLAQLRNQVTDEAQQFKQQQAELTAALERRQQQVNELQAQMQAQKRSEISSPKEEQQKRVTRDLAASHADVASPTGQKEQLTATKAEEMAELRARVEHLSKANVQLKQEMGKLEESQENKEQKQDVEAEVKVLRAQLCRSRSNELDALAKIVGLETSVKVLQEFGQDDFMLPVSPQVSGSSTTPARRSSVAASLAGLTSSSLAKVCELGGSSSSGQNSQDGNEVDNQVDVQATKNTSGILANVLISVEVDFGFGTDTLSVAPWHIRSDFEGIVQEFLAKHRVKPLFAEALVRYLEELENTATCFPVIQQADLADLYSQYG